MQTLKVMASLAISAALAKPGLAAVTNFEIGPIDNSSVSSLAPYTTQDLLIDFTGRYTGSQLVVTLTSGTIYQDATGTSSPPQQLFIGFIPSLAFDTFVAQGGATLETTVGNVNLGGHAVNLGTTAPAQFDTTGINQAWNPAGGSNIDDRSDFLTARITLSDDATGTFKYLASADGVVSIFEGSILNGQFVVPEPASLALILTGLTLMAPRRGGRRQGASIN